MAVDTPTEQRDGALPPVLVSRQPVVDVRDRVAGYRISYAVLDDAGSASPTAALPAELLEDVLAVIGEEEHALGSRAHLPVSREMLLGGGVPEVDPNQVLLRLRYEDAVDPGLAGVLDRAVERGYELELDGLPGPEIDAAILPRFRAIELDLGRFPLQDAAVLVPQIRLRGTVALAAGVQTHEEREAARAVGFDWFTGPFFSTPNVVAGNAIPVGNMKTLVELARLRGSDADLDKLISVIELDLGLGVRLLRYINSAFFGLSGRVRSVRHAAAMLGAIGLSRWAMVAASVGGSEQIPREHALLALTRARACELLAAELSASLDPDEMFTLGLLSAVDVAFRVPLEKVVEELPLDDETTEALLHHTGAAGHVLGSVIHYEQGRYLAPAVRSSLLANADAYREALIWARGAIREIN